jgi:hypothetical protein
LTRAGHSQGGQPGLDVGGDGVGRLIGVDGYQDAPLRVVGDEFARRLGVDLEPVPDHVGRVVGAAVLAGAAQQSLRQHRLRRLQVDRRVQGDAEPGREFMRGDGLWEVPRETVEDESAPGGRRGERRGEHAEHDLVGDQITAGLIDGDLAGQAAAGLGLGPQQLSGGDVLGAGPRR